MNADGSNQVRVSNNFYPDFQPRWLAAVDGLNRHDNRAFAGTAASCLAAGALAAEIGIVHLDAAIERLVVRACRALHHRPPRRFEGGLAALGCFPQAALHLEGEVPGE